VRSKIEPTGQGQIPGGSGSESGASGAAAGSSRSFIEQARRAQIIASAVEVIAEVGYGKASLAAIASRAGISKGVISYHFAGKDELIEQVVTSIYTTGAEYMLEHLQGAKTPTEALRAYLVSNVEFIDRSRTEMLALGEIFVSHRKPDGTPAWGVADEQPALDGLSWLFDWGQREGVFREFDHRVMALTVRRTIDGLPPQLLADPELDTVAFAEELVNLFVRATRKDDDR
jgi:AcrR family transcriptional regulator